MKQDVLKVITYDTYKKTWWLKWLIIMSYLVWRVANQHNVDPIQTIAAPFQNEAESGVFNTNAANVADSTGVK